MVSVVIWEGEVSQPGADVCFKNLSNFCQKLLGTMKEHLEVMIINNGLIECNELLLVHFKLDYKRIDGYLYKNTFDFRMSVTYPYTLNGIMADL